VLNDFEPHIFAAHPTIKALKQSMLDAGAVYAAMSGSGSTIFGLFDDEKKARLVDTPYCYEL
jgi:4-diphosphocytidyl-2-C-methyl-D-erythritol kinase